MPETVNWRRVSLTVRDKSDIEQTSEYYLSDNELSTLEDIRKLQESGAVTIDRHAFVYGGTADNPGVSGTRIVHLPAIISITAVPVLSFAAPAGYDKLRRKTVRDRTSP